MLFLQLFTDSFDGALDRLRDAGLIELGEPFRKLRHQGMLLAQPGWVNTSLLRTDREGGAVVIDEVPPFHIAAGVPAPTTLTTAPRPSGESVSCRCPRYPLVFRP